MRDFSVSLGLFRQHPAASEMKLKSAQQTAAASSSAAAAAAVSSTSNTTNTTNTTPTSSTSSSRKTAPTISPPLLITSFVAPENAETDSLQATIEAQIAQIQQFLQQGDQKPASSSSQQRGSTSLVYSNSTVSNASSADSGICMKSASSTADLAKFASTDSIQSIEPSSSSSSSSSGLGGGGGGGVGGGGLANEGKSRPGAAAVPDSPLRDIPERLPSIAERKASLAQFGALPFPDAFRLLPTRSPLPPPGLLSRSSSGCSQPQSSLGADPQPSSSFSIASSSCSASSSPLIGHHPPPPHPSSSNLIPLGRNASFSGSSSLASDVSSQFLQVQAQLSLTLSGSSLVPSLKESPFLQKDARRRKLQKVATEVLHTELSYGQALELLDVKFRAAIKSVLAADVLEQLLGPFSSLRQLNLFFIGEFRVCIENWESNLKIAHILCKYGNFLKHYSEFGSKFESINSLYSDLYKKNSSFRAAVLQFEKTADCQQLSVQHYLLRPIQRLPQYKLLFEKYVRSIGEDTRHPDFEDAQKALEIVSDAANHTNERMRMDERWQQLYQIQACLRGKYELLRPYRTLLKMGKLQKVSRKGQQERLFLLCSDCLLYLSMAKDGTYRMHHELPLQGMRVETSPQHEFLNELLVHSTTRSVRLLAGSVQQRDEWMRELREAIQKCQLRRSSFVGARRSVLASGEPGAGAFASSADGSKSLKRSSSMFSRISSGSNNSSNGSSSCVTFSRNGSFRERGVGAGSLLTVPEAEFSSLHKASEAELTSCSVEQSVGAEFEGRDPDDEQAGDLLAENLQLGYEAPIWVPDQRVTMCQLCTTEFTLTNRRHHCRACGQVICGKCSTGKAELKYMRKRQRVCDTCLLILQEAEAAEKQQKGAQIEASFVLVRDKHRQKDQEKNTDKDKNGASSPTSSRSSSFRQQRKPTSRLDSSGFTTNLDRLSEMSGEGSTTTAEQPGEQTRLEDGKSQGARMFEQRRRSAGALSASWNGPDERRASGSSVFFAGWSAEDTQGEPDRREQGQKTRKSCNRGEEEEQEEEEQEEEEEEEKQEKSTTCCKGMLSLNCPKQQERESLAVASPALSSSVGRSASMLLPNSRKADQLSEQLSRISIRASGRLHRVPKRLCEVAANDPSSTMAGYMWRRVAKRPWKRFWFVLKDKVLYNYRESEDVLALQSLPVLGYQLAKLEQPLDGHPAQLMFSLSHAGQPPTFFRLDHEELVQKWFDALESATHL